MRITYDAEVDAMYIELRKLEPGQADNREVSPGFIVDFGPDGAPAGVEILDASLVLGESPQRVVVELAPSRPLTAA
jgi:uncharacterized protein YuzE